MIRLTRVRAVAHKEVFHILRDPQILIFALGMPVFLILLFGYAVSFDVEHIPLAIVDQDRSTESRALVAAFTAQDLFDLVATREDAAGVEPLLRRDIARAALVIPSGFSRDVRRGEDATAQLLLDGADNMSASIALGYANSIALAQSLGRAQVQLGGFDMPVEARVRTLFNPRLESSVVLVPGLIVVILVLVAVMLTALTVAREYERGSMEQLFATPVGRLEIILGKLAPYFALGLLQVLLVLVVGVVLFNVPVNGSLPLLFLISSVFLLAMLMQGLVISVLTRNQMVASQAAAISTLLPAMLLSGFVFPVENMPPALQAVAHVLPATYFIDGLRGVLLRGNGLEVVWPDLVAMAIFFGVMLLVATKRFQRRVA
ncbi:MAG: ABC transporter permease [Deltaproteobacteria bacterium HGW-Deltaproteobacteria-14]|jgi:ABC-2 type transport system permease protein|nr:MAG: ABC transporter permease [Deltaproteobacteria bacterium HGW-Deltaproteobacteria-14]